jgi:Holliday junction resolvase RusA-like endonuclease
VIRFTVLGTPAPKGSVRPVMTPAGMRLTPSNNATGQRKLRAWETAVREAARDAVGERDAPVFIKQPLRIAIVFRMARPAGHWSKATGKLLRSAPAYPATKPDGDKLDRLTWDALTGIVWDDDSRIVAWSGVKVYAKPGTEGATIGVALMDSVDDLTAEAA